MGINSEWFSSYQMNVIFQTILQPMGPILSSETEIQGLQCLPEPRRCQMSTILYFSTQSPFICFLLQSGGAGDRLARVAYSVGLSKLLMTTVNTSTTPNSLVGLCFLFAGVKPGKAKNPVAELVAEFPPTLCPIIHFHFNNWGKGCVVTPMLYWHG